MSHETSHDPDSMPTLPPRETPPEERPARPGGAAEMPPRVPESGDGGVFLKKSRKAEAWGSSGMALPTEEDRRQRRKKAGGTIAKSILALIVLLAVCVVLLSLLFSLSVDSRRSTRGELLVGAGWLAFVIWMMRRQWKDLRKAMRVFRETRG